MTDNRSLIECRCQSCDMTLMADDSDCGREGCTASRDVARMADWRQRALTAEAELAAIRAREWRGVYPGMCVDPEACRGYGACPRDYSCCE